jgi:hypothetical protein
MKKYKKGQHIIATIPIDRKIYHGGFGENPVVVEEYQDRKFTTYPCEILHVSSHHYVVKTKYNIKAITLSEIGKQGFVLASKRLIELVKKED